MDTITKRATIIGAPPAPGQAITGDPAEGIDVPHIDANINGPDLSAISADKTASAAPPIFPQDITGSSQDGSDDNRIAPIRRDQIPQSHISAAQINLGQSTDAFPITAGGFIIGNIPSTKEGVIILSDGIQPSTATASICATGADTC